MQEIYCNSHVPTAGPHDLPPLRNGHSNGTHRSNGFRRDAGLNDLKIAHAIKATQVSKPYPKIKHAGARYVVEEWERALADFARRYEKGQVGSKNKEELIRHLTIKRDRRLETLQQQRKERERLQTAELVDRQAKEMLELFKQARVVRLHQFLALAFA
ncbi:unnamed protein product [Gongylonema pulchrum]|uniref:Uncharacterized protein n=1 Tax=Gongylonema pulchrum TaxID=637853 RepID=A0A3P7PQ40_9BILA|nr:unnamed protein product [Gongylonema pulchrum]